MDSQQFDTYAESESTYIRKLLTYSLSATDLRRLYQECNDWDLVTSSCDGTWSTITFNTVARNVTNVLFSRHANDPLIVIDVTARDGNSGGPVPQQKLQSIRSTLGQHGTSLMNPNTTNQHGVALAFVLIMLGFGGLVLVPLLNLSWSALRSTEVSTDDSQVRYTLHAITQEALWMLEVYDDANPYKDCDDPPDGVSDSFADCVVNRGSWALATTPLLAGRFNEEPVDRVNQQDVQVVVEVPEGLSAPPDPTPTPTSSACFHASVRHDPTWVQVGDPITYGLQISNCSSNVSGKDLRNVGVIASAGMSYVAGSTGGDLVTPPKEPIVGDCHSPPPSDELGGTVCLGEAPDNLFLAYPDSGSSYGEAAHPTIKMVGGESRTLTFQLIPSTWGIYYIDVTVCYFNAGQPCDTGSRSDSDKVTPVVVGLFNIQGSGNGHAFGASSKLDDGGSDLISVEPE